MRLTEAISKTTAGVVRRTLERGPLHAWRWVRHHLRERAQERRLGIETAEFNTWRDSVADANCHSYEPLAYFCIEEAIRRVVDDPREEVFLDYGSGKGRAVIVAALQPFRRVVGIELVPELCEIARQNVASARQHLRCANIDIECADATQWRVPADVSCIYLYNPFWEDVLQAVQRSIHASLDEHPRRLKIAYLLNDDQHDSFANCDWLRPTISRHELWERVHLVAYESVNTSKTKDSELHPTARAVRQYAESSIGD